MRSRLTRLVSQALVLGLGLVLASQAVAVDGVIEINTAKALAGGVTLGDTPGFPVTISESGSYRLTSNLTVAGDPSITSGIVVTASLNVTIDLNGFTILSATNCTGIPVTMCTPGGNAMGIDASARQAVTIRNGIIRGFPDRGVNTGPDALIENVVVSSNGLNGIQVGNGSVVRSCRATQNGNDGIAGSAVVVFEGNSSDANGAAGVRTSTSSVVTNNTASSNGTEGFVVFAGSNLRGNAATLNHQEGYAAGGACLLIGNTATGNTGVGMTLGPGSGFSQNVLTNNNGGDANAQVNGSGTDLGANICGVAGAGNGIACP